MNEEDYKAVGAIKNQWIETKDEYLDMALNVIDNLKIKNKQLEDVIEEVRKCIDNMIVYGDDDGDWYFKEVHEEHYEKLLQILNKVGDDNEQ